MRSEISAMIIIVISLFLLNNSLISLLYHLNELLITNIAIISLEMAIMIIILV